MADFSISDLVQKSQQNGTKRGLGGATGGKNRIQIDYVDPNSASSGPSAAQVANMKPQPFIKFVLASSNSSDTATPPPVTSETKAKKSEEQSSKKLRVLSSDSEAEEEKPVDKKSKNKVLSSDSEEEEEEEERFKTITVSGKEEDLLQVLASKEYKSYSVANITGPVKKAVLLAKPKAAAGATDGKEEKVKKPSYLLGVCGGGGGGSKHGLSVELCSKQDGKRVQGKAIKLIAGKAGLCFLLTNGQTHQVKAGEDALLLLDEVLKSQDQNVGVVGGWGEVESAKIALPVKESAQQAEAEAEEVVVKDAQFISFNSKTKRAVLLGADGEIFSGQLQSCKLSSKNSNGLKLLLEKH